jgi:hypothetical protein
MPIMIWVAIIVELVKASFTNEGWEDFAVLLFLQFANATVGFIEESNAGDAIAALKAKLAPQCHVCRDGRWVSMPSRELVPGDLIELKIGDIVPADAEWSSGDVLEVDQAALTGESLPVLVPRDRHGSSSGAAGEDHSAVAPGALWCGAVIKSGECHAIVTRTGSDGAPKDWPLSRMCSAGLPRVGKQPGLGVKLLLMRPEAGTPTPEAVICLTVGVHVSCDEAEATASTFGGWYEKKTGGETPTLVAPLTKTTTCRLAPAPSGSEKTMCVWLCTRMAP